MVQLGRQWIEDQTRHEHMTNHDNNNVHYGSLWILPEKIPPSKKKTLRRWIHRDISCHICWASTLGAAARMMRPKKTDKKNHFTNSIPTHMRKWFFCWLHNHNLAEIGRRDRRRAFAAGLHGSIFMAGSRSVEIGHQWLFTFDTNFERS
jgi:hypothetical protein